MTLLANALIQPLVAPIQLAILFIVKAIHLIPLAIQSIALTIQIVALLIGNAPYVLVIALALMLLVLPAVYRAVLLIQIAHHCVKFAMALLPLAVELIAI